MSSKEELHQLVDLLSDYECGQVGNAVRRAVDGERFWEDDFGLLYNECVKLRYSPTFRSAPAHGPLPDPGTFMPVAPVKSYSASERLELGRPDPPSAGLAASLQQRRSRRDYGDASVGFDELSALLLYACGATGVVPAYGFNRLPLRSFPSHGGLASPEVYLSAQGVSGIPAGIYHYHVLDHLLERIRDGDHASRLSAAAFHEEHVSAASVVLVITGCYGRLRWKYGDRGYRFMCMDAGFLGQSIYLVAEALGLAACAVSGFAQDDLEDLLQIDGEDEIALMLITLGSRADSPE
jgi:SagB-type dehydrogenase family enzyme